MHRQRALPPLNSLAAFEAAARLASFSKAAGELHVTPGAVSRHIKILEQWLGRTLFDRRQRGVTLTAAGEMYLRECSAALDRIAEATARQIEQGRRRLLRVNALATFTMRWLIPRLPSFQSENPGIEVRLSTSRDPIASLRGDFDVVIRGGPEEVPGYDAAEFLREHRVPVCSRALLEELPLRTPADLRHHTLLHAAALPGVWAEWLEAAGVPGLTPRAALTLDHFYLTLQAAVDGLGVAIGPAALIADDVADGRLVKPFAGPTLPEWRYFAYLRRDRGDADAAIRFRDWLLHAERAADVARSRRHVSRVDG